jgi:hypothetical protein
LYLWKVPGSNLGLETGCNKKILWIFSNCTISTSN